MLRIIFAGDMGDELHDPSEIFTFHKNCFKSFIEHQTSNYDPQGQLQQPLRVNPNWIEIDTLSISQLLLSRDSPASICNENVGMYRNAS
jgi:hypothetical protein